MKYSIVMPTYNSSKTITRSIKSVLNQTYGDFELIIIDDGSTDNTIEICKWFEKNDDRVVVYSRVNKGPGAARNYGIKKCTGDYIAFLDSDDYYEVDYLEIINNIVKGKAFDFIFINTANEWDNGEIYDSDNISRHKEKTKKELLSLQIAGTIPWGPCSKVCRADLVKKCAFSGLSVGEESIYSFNLLRLAKTITFVDKSLYHYVHNAKGQHTKGGLDPWRPVVDSLSDYINENNINDYKKAINALALKGLIIAIYRISLNNAYFEAKKKIKQVKKEYIKKYSIYDYDGSVVDFKTKVLGLLIKYRIYIALYLLSVLRNNKKMKA